MRENLRDVLFYVLPRMTPDGAEAVLTTGRWVRSVPRDERVERLHPHWIAEDVDGDGLALLMRKRDDGGEYVESASVPGLLLPRRPARGTPVARLTKTMLFSRTNSLRAEFTSTSEWRSLAYEATWPRSSHWSRERPR